jgi:hypothetical protein
MFVDVLILERVQLERNLVVAQEAVVNFSDTHRPYLG